MQIHRMVWLGGLAVALGCGALAAPLAGAVAGPTTPQLWEPVPNGMRDDFQARLRAYPAAAPVTERMALVRIATTPGRLIRVAGMTATDGNVQPYRSAEVVIADARKATIATVGLGIMPSSRQVLAWAQEETYRFFRNAARPSTWGGDEPLKVTGATFVANFAPVAGLPNSLTAAVRNTVVGGSGGEENREVAPEPVLVEAANRFAALLAPVEAAKVREAPADAIGITAIAQTAGAMVLTWEVGGALKDDWVRVEVETGELCIVEDNRLLVGGIPTTGTTLHVYAISPDGATWHHRGIVLAGKP